MFIIQLIKNQRSIRKFQQKKDTLENLKKFTQPRSF